MGYNKYHNPYVKLQEWNIAVSKQSNVCWIGGISHQYLGKCISNDLLLCIHIPQSAHHETDSNSRIELDLFPIIDFGNWNRFPSLPSLDIVSVTSSALPKIEKHTHSWTLTSTPPPWTLPVWRHPHSNGGWSVPVTHTLHRCLLKSPFLCRQRA